MLKHHSHKRRTCQRSNWNSIWVLNIFNSVHQLGKKPLFFFLNSFHIRFCYQFRQKQRPIRSVLTSFPNSSPCLLNSLPLLLNAWQQLRRRFFLFFSGFIGLKSGHVFAYIKTLGIFVLDSFALFQSSLRAKKSTLEIQNRSGYL